MDRRKFVRNGLSGFLLSAGFAGAHMDAGVREQQSDEGANQLHSGFPQQDRKKVQEVVGASHRSIARVKELVEASPALATASWDWGYGDWESALGAASHTGQKEIALLLLDHGAQPTIFSATMLGQLAVVKAFVEASPRIQRILGPHSITLFSHARAGGESAREVLQYLESVGNADIGPKVLPLAEEEMKRYIGLYAFGPEPEDRFEILAQRELLVIKRREGFPHRLFHLGNHEFQPAGAEAVRIRFSGEGSPASSLTVNDPGIVVVATRL